MANIVYNRTKKQAFWQKYFQQRCYESEYQYNRALRKECYKK
jgi:hypothetical protein